MTTPTVWQEPRERGIWLVGASGRLDHTIAPELESTLSQLLAAGHVHLVVDLSLASYMNSGILRALVSAWRKARQHGGSIHVSGLNSRLLEIFEMVGFQRIFPTHPTSAEAIESIVASFNG